MRIGLTSKVVLLGLAASMSAFAQTKSESSSKLPDMVNNLKKTCQSDMEKFCKDVNPGAGRIAACLDSKEDQLSTECKAAWTTTKSQVSEKMDKADVAFRKNCGRDVQKFCADVPSGRGRLLECLGDHKNDLSSSCERFHSSLEKKLSELVG